MSNCEAARKIFIFKNYPKIMKKYLVVCQQNQMRSPYVAEYLRNLLKEKNIEAIVESTGLSDSSPKKLTKEMADNADVIFAMDKKVYNKIIEEYSQLPQKVVNLDILDVYAYGTFSDVGLGWALIGKSEKEKEEILDKPEIQLRLSLREVVESRKHLFERYIK